MPRLGFGTWKLKGKDAYNPVRWALEEGYRLIDTATFYENETQVGKAIHDSKIPRKNLFITTKVWDSDLGEKTKKAFKKSLNKLNMNYIDLYLIHWPRRLRNESWKVMEELYREDKIKAIGVANFAVKHLRELLNNFDITPAVNQFELHPFLFNQEEELIQYCKSHKIQVEAYSPLTHGKRLNNPTIKSIADKYNKTTAQILLRWALQHNFIVIPKSSNRDHIQENADIFDFEIADIDMKEIDSINEKFRLLSNTSTWN
ncbi:MAG: 2,5-diketo-D-gluconate reductase A [Promethearchaeota archaeon]|nr:MAG: 2,5-diketo-D-gluconate reductase A [Candidatus Lokiarchaeota archaeon]